MALRPRLPPPCGVTLELGWCRWESNNRGKARASMRALFPTKVASPDPDAAQGRAPIPRVGAPLSGAGNWINFQARRINFRRQARKKCWGVFRVFGVCFRVLGGVFVFWGVFPRCAAIYSARSAAFLGVLFSIFLYKQNQTRNRPQFARQSS